MVTRGKTSWANSATSHTGQAVLCVSACRLCYFLCYFRGCKGASRQGKAKVSFEPYLPSRNMCRKIRQGVSRKCQFCNFKSCASAISPHRQPSGSVTARRAGSRLRPYLRRRPNQAQAGSCCAERAGVVVGLLGFCRLLGLSGFQVGKRTYGGAILNFRLLIWDFAVCEA